MNDPLRGWPLPLVVAVLAIPLLTWADGDQLVLRVAVLGIAGLGLVPVLGWLRTLWLLPPAIAGLAAWAVAEVMRAGQAVPVAAVAASAVGVAAGAGAAEVTRRVPLRLRPWVGLAAVAGVWAVVLPYAGTAPAPRPVLFGLDLSAGRGLAGLALVLLGAAAWAVANLARSHAGRGIAVAGASPRLATRAGVSAPRAWMAAGAVSGLLSAWAGLLLALEAQALPAANQFAPAVAVLWLGAPLLGGVAWPSGALLGALAVGAVAALAGGHAAVAGGAAAVGALLGAGGAVGLITRRGRS